ASARSSRQPSTSRNRAQSSAGGGGRGRVLARRSAMPPLSPTTCQRQVHAALPGLCGACFRGRKPASGCCRRRGRPESGDAPMRMDKLTSRFQQALADAQSLAVGRDHNLIEPVHLLVALLDQQGGGARPLLARADVNVPLLRERLGEILDGLPKVSGQEGNVSLGNDLSRLLNITDKLAQQRGDAFIASELFLLAALEDNG